MKATKKQQQLPSNSIIAKLLAEAKESIVQFRGFLGETKGDNVAVYRDFSLTKYVEIPISSILHVTRPESDEDPVTVFVPASTEVSIVQKQRGISLSQYVYREWPMEYLGSRILCSEARQHRDVILRALDNPKLSNEEKERLENALFKADIDIATYC